MKSMVAVEDRGFLARNPETVQEEISSAEIDIEHFRAQCRLRDPEELKAELHQQYSSRDVKSHLRNFYNDTGSHYVLNDCSSIELKKLCAIRNRLREHLRVSAIADGME